MPGEYIVFTKDHNIRHCLVVIDDVFQVRINVIASILHHGGLFRVDAQFVDLVLRVNMVVAVTYRRDPRQVAFIKRYTKKILCCIQTVPPEDRIPPREWPTVLAAYNPNSFHVQTLTTF